MRRGLLLIALLCLLAAPTADEDAAPSVDHSTPVRGMTVSCQTWGGEWGTDGMVKAMTELRRLGVNWISIHPYAVIRGDGSVRFPVDDDEPTWITRPIREAHRLGLKIMIKPHLAYWGSPFSWRGEIEFQDETQWGRFFEQYEAWITHVAALSADADAFVVGTELDRTVSREASWRRVIAGVRREFTGPVTYAANWTDYQQVPFWDDLDVIGIQAYFPLAEEPGLPETVDLVRAWETWLGRLGKFSRRQDKPIVLTELGYPRSPAAAVRPWEGREGGDDALETQRRCLEAALAAIDDDDVVLGAFLWKWFAGPHKNPRENFLMTTPPMRRVISEHWGRTPRSAAPTPRHARP